VIARVDRRSLLALVGLALPWLGACSPPAECAALTDAWTQDRTTVDALASQGGSVSAAQSADSARAYRDAAAKLQATSAKVAATKPSDLALSQAAATYSIAEVALVTSLGALADGLDKLSAAQASVEGADARAESARMKLVTACLANPKPAGCDETRTTLAKTPTDEAARHQTERDLDNVKFDAALVPLRGAYVIGLKEMDSSRKAAHDLELDAKGSLSTAKLTEAGADIEKRCSAK
jgi:hypothetical protein